MRSTNGVYERTRTASKTGRNTYGVQYSSESLTGTGTIEGHHVDCISPEWMVKFHTGYKLTKSDFRDVSALCERFGIELPAEYREFGEDEL